MTAETHWPVKARDIHNHHFDSTVWDRFVFRPDDIVVATYAKSGTTWVQQIVGQLVFDGDPEIAVAELSPWVDLRVPPAEVKLAALEAQAHRRIVKTHLPIDALVFSPAAKYLFIARDGRDVLWSLHNHHARANALWYELINDTPGRVGPPIGPPDPDIRQYFRDWLDGDGHPFWPFWENIRSWWQVRHLPNVMMLHFADLKADMEGQIRRVAGFLGIEPSAEGWERILLHCSFDWMKAHGAGVAPLGGAVWEGGADSFIHRGTNGRWREMLTPQDIADYEAAALRELGPDCARWLAEGGAA